MNDKSEIETTKSGFLYATGDLKVTLGEESERGPWIYTASGQRYFPTAPLPEDIEVGDIARALAQINRYAGHTRWPVSVALHSVLCSLLSPPDCALEALLHDAAEAYLGDVSRPIKEWLRQRDPSWTILEHLNERAIARRFDLRYPWPEAVAAADNRALAVEVRDAHCPEFHALLEQRGLEADPQFKFRKCSAARAERLFLARYEDLRKRRDQ